jgi:hypothetical protein
VSQDEAHEDLHARSSDALLTACKIMAQSDGEVATTLQRIEHDLEFLLEVATAEHSTPERQLAAGLALAVAQHRCSTISATHADGAFAAIRRSGLK